MSIWYVKNFGYISEILDIFSNYHVCVCIWECLTITCSNTSLLCHFVPVLCLLYLGWQKVQDPQITELIARTETDRPHRMIASVEKSNNELHLRQLSCLSTPVEKMCRRQSTELIFKVIRLKSIGLSQQCKMFTCKLQILAWLLTLIPSAVRAIHAIIIQRMALNWISLDFTIILIQFNHVLIF